MERLEEIGGSVNFDGSSEDESVVVQILPTDLCAYAPVSHQEFSLFDKGNGSFRLGISE